MNLTDSAHLRTPFLLLSSIGRYLDYVYALWLCLDLFVDVFILFESNSNVNILVGLGQGYRWISCFH